MTTKYNVQGSVVMLQNDQDMPTLLDKIPVGTYNVSFHPEIGYHLTVAKPFTLPKKVYGTVESRVSRFLSTFEMRSGITGVLLAGQKGSGKSLAMKKASIEGLRLGYPTLIVNDAYCGTNFNKFMAAIAQPCVVIFDEFEKIYNKEQQEALLTLLDGVFQTKKLVIFTVNQALKINENMINRPGRLFYNVRYTGLEQQFIVEYCEDNLKDKSKIDQIVILTSMFSDFNFDMLQALVEELNRYGESVKEAIQLLNVKPDGVGRYRYLVSVMNKATKELIPEKYLDYKKVDSPLMEQSFYCGFTDTSIEVEDDQYIPLVLESIGPHATIRPDLSEFKYDSDNYVVTLTREEYKSYDFTSHLA